jgi:NADP-dependent 3-hydroxy acid dehydrogenase YdfG
VRALLCCWAAGGVAVAVCVMGGAQVALLNPYAIATEWWDEPARGGGKAPKTAAEKAEMLSPEDVAAAVDAIIEQPIASDVERVIIEPAKKPKAN